jgi:hypothetical protein
MVVVADKAFLRGDQPVIAAAPSSQDSVPVVWNRRWAKLGLVSPGQPATV